MTQHRGRDAASAGHDPDRAARPADHAHEDPDACAIPDDNAGGVQSTLFVPVSGHIKDLDVRIDSIDHSFVGDLKVELTSPDNSTTVRLIEHVGGPNNGGDDLVGHDLRRRGARR